MTVHFGNKSDGEKKLCWRWAFYKDMNNKHWEECFYKIKENEIHVLEEHGVRQSDCYVSSTQLNSVKFNWSPTIYITLCWGCDIFKVE